MIKLLAKANDDVLSHCRCEAPLASVPGQLDCPWCGCGWLVCCTNCRKAFTYARVVEVDTDYETFVRGDRQRGGYADGEEAEIRDCAEWLEESFADFAVGQQVVYLDGLYFALDDAPSQFDGLHATHDLDRLPHFVALTEPTHLNASLGKQSYWQDRERLELGD